MKAAEFPEGQHLCSHFQYTFATLAYFCTRWSRVLNVVHLVALVELVLFSSLKKKIDLPAASDSPYEEEFRL